MVSERAQSVVGIGEILWDCFGERRLPGGAPANVVYHVNALGLRGRICSGLGADADGDALLELLRGRGLDVDLIHRDPDRPTGTVTVDASDPAAPTYVIHRNVAWDAIPATAELERACRDCEALCVGTLAQRSEVSRATIRRCLDWASGALTVYDVNLRAPFYCREWIEPTLERSRVVKLNEDEARLLDGLLGIGAGTAIGFCRALLRRYAIDLACVTRGARGCVLIDRDGIHEERGTRVDVVDTVGAGDAFTAALIDGLLRGRPLPDVARAANRRGAAVAARAGAMPELPELQERTEP